MCWHISATVESCCITIHIKSKFVAQKRGFGLSFVASGKLLCCYMVWRASYTFRKYYRDCEWSFLFIRNWYLMKPGSQPKEIWVNENMKLRYTVPLHSRCLMEDQHSPVCHLHLFCNANLLLTNNTSSKLFMLIVCLFFASSLRSKTSSFYRTTSCDLERLTFALCSKDESALAYLSSQRSPAQNYQWFVQICLYPRQSCGTDSWWPPLSTDRQKLLSDLLSHSHRKTQLKLSAVPFFLSNTSQHPHRVTCLMVNWGSL